MSYIQFNCVQYGLHFIIRTNYCVCFFKWPCTIIFFQKLTTVTQIPVKMMGNATVTTLDTCAAAAPTGKESTVKTVSGNLAKE